MEAFKGTLPIVCNGFNKDNILISSSWCCKEPFRSHVLDSNIFRNIYSEIFVFARMYVKLLLNRKLSRIVCELHVHAGLIFNGGNGGNCLRCPWSLPWYPFKSPNRNLQIPHRGALCQGQIALPLQVQSIRPVHVHICTCIQILLDLIQTKSFTVLTPGTGR